MILEPPLFEPDQKFGFVLVGPIVGEPLLLPIVFHVRPSVATLAAVALGGVRPCLPIVGPGLTPFREKAICEAE